MIQVNSDVKPKNLVNMLEDANPGDLIVLKSPKGNKVSGFLVEYNVKTITLSHESPTNSRTYADHRFPRCSIGNRTYHLKHFSEYEVVQP